MKMKNALGCLMVLLLLASCEKDFNMDSKNTGNELVINSLFNDGAPVTAYVTQSYPIGSTSSNIKAISDARVELYEDNVFKEVMHYVPSDSLATFGAYLSNLIPKQGRTYTIKTVDAKYTDASASDQVPVAARLVSYSLQSYTDTGDNPTGKMSMAFNDDPTVSNYYRINMWIGGWQRSIQGTDTTYAYQGYAIRPQALCNLSDTVRDGVFLLFSDRGFNGQLKSLPLSFNVVDSSSFSSLNLYVELHTVSKAHYEYFRTLNLYRTTNGSSEPVFIYSNINNGLGVFVAEHVESMNFVIK